MVYLTRLTIYRMVSFQCFLSLLSDCLCELTLILFSLVLVRYILKEYILKEYILKEYILKEYILKY